MQNQSILKNRDFWYCIGIFFLAVFLRLYNLNAQALFLDEAWSWVASQLSFREILVLLKTDPHPVLYYFSLKAFLTFLPDSEAMLRLLSVLFSLASIAIILLVSPRWFGKKASLFAGLLVSVSSFDIYYAQEARMYSMLAFFWISSFFLLLSSLSGKRWNFLLWGLINIALVWTHFYGILVVTTHLIIASGVWGVALLRKNGKLQNEGWHSWSLEIPIRFFACGMGISFGAIVSALPLLWNYKSADAGGAWIPGYEDIIYLLGLLSSGLSAARTHFLDGAHLIIPAFSDIPNLIWSLSGAALFGILAIKGTLNVWKSQETTRWVIVLILTSILLPIMSAFTYAIVFRSALWAYKPFLGAMYLFFLLVGWGFVQISKAYFRSLVLLVVICLPLVSLAPYYSSWQKSNANLAFQSAPALASNEIVMLEKGYISPLAFYYLGTDVSLVGLNIYDPENISLSLIKFGDTLLSNNQKLTCDDAFWVKIERIKIHGTSNRVFKTLHRWPECVTAKELLFFEDGKWVNIIP